MRTGKSGEKCSDIRVQGGGGITSGMGSEPLLVCSGDGQTDR